MNRESGLDFQLDFQRPITCTIRIGCARDKGLGKGTWVDSSAEFKEDSTHQHPLPREVGFSCDLAPCPKSMDRETSHRTQRWVFIE